MRVRGTRGYSQHKAGYPGPVIQFDNTERWTGYPSKLILFLFERTMVPENNTRMNH